MLTFGRPLGNASISVDDFQVDDWLTSATLSHTDSKTPNKGSWVESEVLRSSFLVSITLIRFATCLAVCS